METATAKQFKHLDFMLFDIVSLCLSYFISYNIRFPGGAFFDIEREYTDMLVINALIVFLLDFVLGNVSGILRRGYLREFIQVSKLSFFSFLAVSFILYISHLAAGMLRLLVAGTFIIFTILSYTVRTVMKKIYSDRLRAEAENHNTGRAVFVLSDSKSINEIMELIKADYISHFVVKAIYLCDGGRSTDFSEDIKVFTDETESLNFICRQWVDEVFIYLPDSASQPKEFIDACREMGVTIHSVLYLRDMDSGKFFAESIGNHIVLTTAFTYIDPLKKMIKRVIDIIGALVGCIMTVLIGLIIGPMICLSSPGPLIFKQERIGQSGKKFYVYKFRSMYPDAEERKKELIAKNIVSDGMMFKMDFDPRIIGNKILPDGTKKTGIGDFIRKTSLDEFPQFFNVLFGDMSLVGTRPPTVDEWEKYKYHHRARLAMKPGITGLWQVSGRSQITDFEEVVKLDTEYITHFSLTNDIKILLKTIIVVLKRKGSM